MTPLPYNHWFVCLDLSEMDDVLISYSQFLAAGHNPETITFLHIVESASAAEELAELFPDLEKKEDVEKIIRKEIAEKTRKHFGDSETEIRVLIKEGKPTGQIISLVNSVSPDLLIIGKKTEYVGEGVVARRIVQYVPCSILFVPESSKHSLQRALVATDFSDQSAAAFQAAKFFVGPDGSVTAQHIFRYPSRYFPYLPSDEEKERIDKHLEEQKSEFIRKHNLPDHVKFVFTLHKEGKLADCVYDQAVDEQADLIVTGSKSNKKIPGFLRHDFNDKMAYYSFEIPLLIQKNKERHQKFLDKVFGSASS